MAVSVRARALSRRKGDYLYSTLFVSLFFKHGILAFRIAIVLYFVFSSVLALIALQTMNLDPDMIDLLLLIMSALSLFYYHCVSLTPEIVYQASRRTMTDRTHEVGIS